VSATFLVWEGEPAETIIAASESEEADVIVMGSHGRGRIGRLLLGSTSARVSEEATRRVIVVPS
jgi:nucleotide-binding universal stress UspA family protein